MGEEQTVKRRRSIRLPAYDYRWPGAYFVTICTPERSCLFGGVTSGAVVLNATGRIVESCWQAIPTHFPNVILDEFVVMPNHVHGIVILAEADRSAVGAQHAVPLQRESLRQFQKPPAESLSSVIGSFKSASTRQINLLRGTSGAPVWQRNYYEHVVRNEEDLQAIRQYIRDNPAQWAMDEENPARNVAVVKRS
jgi:REP element-mobilizing transposase RayT